MENFKKLNVISQDEFETLTPKLPIDTTQEIPPPPPCQTGDCTLHMSEITMESVYLSVDLCFIN